MGQEIKFGKGCTPPPPTKCLSSNRTAMKVTIKTNKNPEDTSWKVYKEGGRLIAQGSDFDGRFEAYSEIFCVRKNSCPYIKVKDLKGDGFGMEYHEYAYYRVPKDFSPGYEVHYYDKSTKEWELIAEYDDGPFRTVTKDVC